MSKQHLFTSRRLEVEDRFYGELAQHIDALVAQVNISGSAQGAVRMPLINFVEDHMQYAFELGIAEAATTPTKGEF